MEITFLKEKLFVLLLDLNIVYYNIAYYNKAVKVNPSGHRGFFWN